MKVYFRKLGGHVHCRVYVGGALSGTLVFSRDEWKDSGHWFTANVAFIDETPLVTK